MMTDDEIALIRKVRREALLAALGVVRHVFNETAVSDAAAYYDICDALWSMITPLTEDTERREALAALQGAAARQLRTNAAKVCCEDGLQFHAPETLCSRCGHRADCHAGFRTVESDLEAGFKKHGRSWGL